ncbi:MAG: TonB-dependent receptor [Sphingopyxis sp.]|nr:TonB-dependent receptor [Sphingopyxis sp.]
MTRRLRGLSGRAAMSLGGALETGVEGAFNRLDSDVDLFGVAAGGALTPIDLPVDEAVVSEYRGEAFVNAGRSLTSNLRLDLGLTYEQSRLTVSGDADAERTLRFLKPKISADWRPGDNWRIQASLTRTVAQLDFNDFVGAAELANERVDGGNPDLLPQRTWEARLSVERPVLGDGRIQLEAGYNAISLLQDRVPVEGGDAPGNLGNGRLMFLRGVVDVPLAAIGIPGGRLTFNGVVRDTSVRDPYTGLDRDFSGASRWLRGRFPAGSRQFRLWLQLFRAAVGAGVSRLGNRQFRWRRTLCHRLCRISGDTENHAYAHRRKYLRRCGDAQSLVLRA